jgi:hypothetical protein
MHQPEGFVEKGNDWVWHLFKSLYLKQAGCCWHFKLNEELEKIGFKRIVCEHSIWIYMKDNVHIIVPVFIDDMTIASKSKHCWHGTILWKISCKMLGRLLKFCRYF